MKKLLTAIVLAAVAASPAMAAKARKGDKRIYLQSDRAVPYVPYGIGQRGGPAWSSDTWDADPNIRDRLRRDYPDFH
jgi:hypothetical protein